MTSLVDEDAPCLSEEIIEIQNNWHSVVKEGRKPNLNLKIKGESMPLKDAANIFLEKMERFANSIPEEAKDLKKNILNSIKSQEEKIINSDITPSGRIIREMAENNWTWQEFNQVYFKRNKDFFTEFKKDLSLFDNSAKKSFAELKEIEAKKEIPFEIYLKQYLSSI
jgi:glutamate--cysteine ligase